VLSVAFDVRDGPRLYSVVDGANDENHRAQAGQATRLAVVCARVI